MFLVKHLSVKNASSFLIRVWHIEYHINKLFSTSQHWREVYNMRFWKEKSFFYSTSSGLLIKNINRPQNQKSNILSVFRNLLMTSNVILKSLIALWTNESYCYPVSWLIAFSIQYCHSLSKHLSRIWSRTVVQTCMSLIQKVTMLQGSRTQARRRDTWSSIQMHHGLQNGRPLVRYHRIEFCAPIHYHQDLFYLNKNKDLRSSLTYIAYHKFLL